MDNTSTILRPWQMRLISWLLRVFLQKQMYHSPIIQVIYRRRKGGFARGMMWCAENSYELAEVEVYTLQAQNEGKLFQRLCTPST